MKVLFITRNFPPGKGGLERFSFNLYSALRKQTDVILLRWSKRKLLFVGLPYLLIRSIRILFTQKIEIIYLNEGLLSILTVFLKPFKVPVVITINGLDITYRNKVYQWVIPKCVSATDGIICLSRATKDQCAVRGIPEGKIVVIPPSFSDEFYINEDKVSLKQEAADRLGLRIKDKKILLSVGRLIKRKGIHWFIDNVIARLTAEVRDFVYIVAGDGPMRHGIENIIRNKGLSGQVVLLGKIGDALLKVFYNISDIFIMPNIPVEADIEGFGLAMLEAASCEVPVIASDLDGIRDAISDGKNGYLVAPFDSDAYLAKIKELLSIDNRDFNKKAREFTVANYNSDKVASEYLDKFKGITGNE